MSGNQPVVVNDHKQRKLTWFKIDIRAYTMIAALVFIWIYFAMMSDAFLTTRNLSNLFLQMSVTAILAIGMVLIIVAGQIDLSVGSLMGLTGGIAAILNVWYDWDTIPVIIATLAAGALIGLFQGWVVAYQAVPAFIVTLGGMLIFRGILLGITDSVTIAPLSEDLRFMGQSYVDKNIGYLLAIAAFVILVFLQIRRRQSRVKYGFDVAPYLILFGKLAFFGIFIGGFVYLMNDYKGIPVPFILVIILAIIFTFIAKNTIFGRHVYALGGNADAARLSGINIKRRILLVFVLGNTLAAIAGLVYTARLNAATSGAGEMYELDAIAACVIGGTSLMGGVGTISGAIIGALVMASLDNGMSIMNIESFWQQIVKGSILVVAVWIDIYSRRKSKQA
ncbi:sugar ABC transporter permease [Marinicrinis sediminis]|uniref:Xylose transport system permease protein XylH n=1 Tax=Marinicrinis sediminis TaxID=1652465 RepID=A0ABW5R6U2_9BACL